MKSKKETVWTAIAIVTLIVMIVGMPLAFKLQQQENQPAEVKVGAKEGVSKNVKSAEAEEILQDLPEILSIDDYRREVFARGGKRNFITEQESRFLESKGLKVRNPQYGRCTFYSAEYNWLCEVNYPILAYSPNTDKIWLWYITELGEAYVCEIAENNSNWLMDCGQKLLESPHTSSSDQKIIVSNAEYVLTYNGVTGEITSWSFGVASHTYRVPENSTFVGISKGEGLVFLNTSEEVYILTNDGRVAKIADHVMAVIECNYYYDADNYSQPLIVKQDGTLHAYLGLQGDQNQPYWVDILHK